ncbi:MAG: GNAT family N-acetyltransferase [Spirochaetales bacterium]|uniref:GNAT family N-acetyltransferase n=1 Tax=Candidatus Thalassospirochaeta sargassi TaxID=3119039 RepID=A0AAJ1ICR6_9SPIO|nr:GNAT family N-acetyltransferase [Spirochaetales bacterium]
MQIKNLENCSKQQLYKAFLSAFQDYEIKVDMSFEQFKSITWSKDFKPCLSVGSFENEELTGFVFTGVRTRKGSMSAYDIATGVTAGSRNIGIGSVLLEHLLVTLKSAGVSNFFLEVLEKNSAARHLYEKYGFEICRRLECFWKDTDAVKKQPMPETGLAIGHDSSAVKDLDPVLFHSFEPAWQNEFATWLNLIEEHELVTLSDGDKVIAYAIVHSTGGTVLQFGIHPEHRGQSVEKQLISLLAERTEAEKMRFINMEEGSPLCAFLREQGFNNDINQYEMVYYFK